MSSLASGTIPLDQQAVDLTRMLKSPLKTQPLDSSPAELQHAGKASRKAEAACRLGAPAKRMVKATSLIGQFCVLTAAQVWRTVRPPSYDRPVPVAVAFLYRRPEHWTRVDGIICVYNAVGPRYPEEVPRTCRRRAPWRDWLCPGPGGAVDRVTSGGQRLRPPEGLEHMAFKRSSGTTATPADPEQLYRQLALVNNGPANLWLHQGDVLRSWHANHLNAADVAIELPTGAGKTLVGGLIGDYLRRSNGERVTYLCATRQLAKQTAEKLTQYGISNVLLIGRVRTWNAADRSRYTSANAIAVSVYSHVFNANPALDDAQLLLLDDAHAAEGYVAGPWSLEISRDEQSAYHDVLSALADALDPLVVARLRADAPDAQYRNSVYLASPLGVSSQAGPLEEVLSAAAAASKISDEAGYALRFLQGHLGQCMVYLSHRRLLIRPLIPPRCSTPPSTTRPAAST